MSIEQYLYRQQQQQQQSKRKAPAKKSSPSGSVAEIANKALALALADLPSTASGSGKKAAGGAAAKKQQQHQDYLERLMANMDDNTKEQMLKHSIIIAYCHCQNVTIRRDT